MNNEGSLHLFLNGFRLENHAGDGTWFYALGELRVSECRRKVAQSATAKNWTLVQLRPGRCKSSGGLVLVRIPRHTHDRPAR